MGLVSALIPAAFRAFAVPRRQAGREQSWVWALPSCHVSGGTVMSLMPWQLMGKPKSWPQRGPQGWGVDYGTVSPLVWP